MQSKKETINLPQLLIQTTLYEIEPYTHVNMRSCYASIEILSFLHNLIPLLSRTL